MTTITAILSIVDQTIPLIWATEALCFECPDVEAAVKALQRGLDSMVSQLPFLTGEVFEDPHHQNRTSIEWSEARPRMLLEEIDGSRLPPIKTLKQLRLPLHALGCNDLLPLAINELKSNGRSVAFASAYARVEGGLVLTSATHHALMDGKGAQQIMSKWAYYTGSIGSDVIVDRREPFSRYQRLKHAINLVRDSKINREVSRSGDAEKESADSCDPKLVKLDQNLPPPKLSATSRIFVLSLNKLDQLSEAVRDHISQPFSLNALITALLWQSITIVRRRRLAETIDLSGPSPISELSLLMDCRKMLEEVMPGSRDWVGNLALPLLPEPSFPLKAFSDKTLDLQSYDSNGGNEKGSKGLKCHQSLPRLVKKLATVSSNFTVETMSNSMSSLLAEASSPDFDYRILRSRPMALNGLHVVVSNVRNIDVYHDFGPHLGRPAFMRSPGYGIDGLCIVLPQKTGDYWTAHERDEVEIQVYLREDDMEEFVKCEVLQQLWCTDPV